MSKKKVLKTIEELEKEWRSRQVDKYMSDTLDRKSAILAATAGKLITILVSSPYMSTDICRKACSKCLSEVMENDN